MNDLNNDSKANLLTNGFYEPEFLINILSKNINKHKQFLNTFSKKNAGDLNRQYQGLTKALLEIHNSIELPIALAMQDEPGLKDNPLIIQSLKPIDEKNFSIQFYLRRLININSLISTFTGYDVLNPIKQKIIMNISKISQSEWDALPQADKDLLLNNFSGTDLRETYLRSTTNECTFTGANMSGIDLTKSISTAGIVQNTRVTFNK